MKAPITIRMIIPIINQSRDIFISIPHISQWHSPLSEASSFPRGDFAPRPADPSLLWRPCLPIIRKCMAGHRSMTPKYSRPEETPKYQRATAATIGTRQHRTIMAMCRFVLWFCEWSLKSINTLYVHSNNRQGQIPIFDSHERSRPDTDRAAEAVFSLMASGLFSPFS